MENLQLSTQEVLDHIRQVELPIRRNEGNGDIADEVVRYGSFVGSSVECHANLERAMNHARLHIDTTERSGRSVESGRVILAGSLSGSKGRFTRSWHAPDGGLWGCLIHADTLMPHSAMLLSLAVGVAACETVRQAGVENGALRWVNDVLIDGAKVAGFLIESHTGPVNGEQFHLIGFGININNRDFPTELADTAASIRDVLGRPVILKNFALHFIAKLVWNIGLLYFTEAKQPDWINAPENIEHPVIRRWKLLSDTLGKRVAYGCDIIEKTQYCGVVTGIGYDGGLHMTLDDGSSITEYSGEIRYL
jgi:BirA family biotin operon repressor/biotin-[acetyl-CoA-carboxylase] ligase